jgi:hypothetical protein
VLYQHNTFPTTNTLAIRSQLDSRERGPFVKAGTAVFFLLVSVAVLLLAVPLASAAVPGNNSRVSPYDTTPYLNVTAGAFPNHTMPAQYAITPTPIRIEVGISETSIPAPKGEMAAGPRSIGFSFGPVTLVALVLVVVAVSAGMWYMLRRKPEENDKDE